MGEQEREAGEGLEGQTRGVAPAEIYKIPRDSFSMSVPTVAGEGPALGSGPEGCVMGVRCMQGEMFVNGKTISNEHFKEIMGYVPQVRQQ